MIQMPINCWGDHRRKLLLLLVCEILRCALRCPQPPLAHLSLRGSGIKFRAFSVYGGVYRTGADSRCGYMCVGGSELIGGFPLVK
ncbi:hypothetical protein F5887DRAFT_970802 [Amanita rubescens]|nr:hypothetical protein F5887DRAFT_970802 [Amanita rubescens]